MTASKAGVISTAGQARSVLDTLVGVLDDFDADAKVGFVRGREMGVQTPNLSDAQLKALIFNQSEDDVWFVPETATIQVGIIRSGTDVVAAVIGFPAGATISFDWELDGVDATPANETDDTTNGVSTIDAGTEGDGDYVCKITVDGTVYTTEALTYTT